ncbi:hypothetical protein GALMADRAFT_753547 [Galerina marginata CBS 339.88]|uniref:CHAT domain-containing protein n=1 Tax=Galerina marginata (strain CBS 339.88) TaxID=685588 RepID=A0A067SRA4_GALM3|nr:hypothetical protein GALMADRAFT_753547 [Galerina marginata CBS 339.88]
MFELHVVPADENEVQPGAEGIKYEAFVEDLLKNPERVFTWVLEVSDDMPDKPHFLNHIGDILLARFHDTRNVDDIDNSVLAYNLALQFLPRDDAEFMDFLHDSGVSALERYNLIGNLEDIDQAITKFEICAEGMFDSHTDIRGRLNNLGISLRHRFERTGNLTDIAKAIASHQKAVQLTPDGHVNMPAHLNSLGNSFQCRFEHAGDPTDISEAILFHQKALQLIPEGHADMPGWLNNLGNSLRFRFERMGDLADISEAVSSQQKAVQLTPEGHADMPDWLNNLGNSLRCRFESTGDLADISEAISSQQKAVQLTPEGHAEMPGLLNDLGNSFQCRFEHAGDPTDIFEAISSQQKAVQLTPNGHADIPNWLNNLGNSFIRCFECTGDITNISEAISSQQKAVQLTPDGHANMSGSLNNLGISLRLRFQHAGDLTDISESISSHEKAVQLTPEGHAIMPVLLNNLGNSFQCRFNRTGDLADNSEAISSQQKAVQLTPEGHAHMANWLNNLGISLQCRFEHTGDFTNISEAISLQQRAVQLTPEGHADMPARLNNLGNSFQCRYERAGDLTDISEAITFHQKAVRLTPDGHANMPAHLTDLGNSFQRRFEQALAGDPTDIFEGILFHRKALQLTPEGHADIPGWLNNLGNSLLSRFESTRDLADISEAISLQQKAVQLTPEGHTDMPSWLNNLGNMLRCRFDYTGDLTNISESVSSHRKAVQLTPDGHADMPRWLNNLGTSLHNRFEQTGDQADVHGAISNYRRSATYVSGSPSIRLEAAARWARLATTFDSSQLLEAYGTVIDLISLVIGLEHTIRKRYTNLINISQLSASAAVAAFSSERHDLALEWLEQGRCLVWSQLNDLRTPLDDLRIHNPTLADDVLRVSRALENAGSRAEPAAYTAETSMMKKISIQDEADGHIKLAREWDQLLLKVRAVPQFEYFLKPALCTTLLKQIPDSGPVVVINIHKDRSDALALVSGTDTPRHIILHQFSYEKADNLRNRLKTHLVVSGVRVRGSESDTRGMRYEISATVIKDILSELWTFVVKPILNGLGYPSPSNISRIWWCVTGPLAFLPIHAAGIYASAGSIPGICSTLSDFAVPSYTPTVRALVERVQSRRKITDEDKGLFMVSQPDTPTLPRIPGTTEEVRVIKELLVKHNFRHLCLERSAATINPVITNMGAYSCVHFACHASQNTDEPLQSGFYLHDGRLELSSIIKEHLVDGDLAFLSACQTSTGDEKLSEEAVHLAAGMLAVGYRGVVATMWAIGDSYGPKLAENFYRSLLSSGADEEKGSDVLSSDGAARALHYATQQARTKLGDSNEAFLTWVPYVHFGL